MSHTEDISTHCQVELAFLFRTFSLLQYFDDDDTLLEYFREFLPLILKLKPLSLANENNLYSFSEPTDDTKKKHALLSCRELQYLKSENHQSERIRSSHVIEPLFEAFEAQYTTSNRHEALMICLALAVKSGRLSLLVRCAVLLMRRESSSSLVGSTRLEHDSRELLLDSRVLSDLINHVKSTHSSSCTDSIFHGGEDLLGHRLSLNSDAQWIPDADMDSIQSPPVHAVLTFGKADHGKLGHSDTQVRYIEK